MKTPTIHGADEPFPLGGLKVVRASERDRLTIVAAGVTLHEAIAAHDELMQSALAVRVIDLYCVKPLDATALIEAGRSTHATLLTVEDHYAEGGLGDAVLEAVAGAGLVTHRLAVREIPRSGPPAQLLEHYGIGRRAIAAKVREILGAGEERRSAA